MKLTGKALDVDDNKKKGQKYLSGLFYMKDFGHSFVKKTRFQNTS